VTEGIDHPNRFVIRAQIAKALLMPRPEPASLQESQQSEQDAIVDADLVMPFIDKLITTNRNLHALLKARDFQIDREREKARKLTPPSPKTPPNWVPKPGEMVTGSHRDGVTLTGFFEGPVELSQLARITLSQPGATPAMVAYVLAATVRPAGSARVSAS
jgi:hypothetical protein